MGVGVGLRALYAFCDEAIEGRDMFVSLFIVRLWLTPIDYAATPLGKRSSP